MANEVAHTHRCPDCRQVAPCNRPECEHLDTVLCNWCRFGAYSRHKGKVSESAPKGYRKPITTRR